MLEQIKLLMYFWQLKVLLGQVPSSLQLSLFSALLLSSLLFSSSYFLSGNDHNLFYNYANQLSWCHTAVQTTHC